MIAESFKKLMRTDRPEKQVGGDSWVGYVLGTIGCLMLVDEEGQNAQEENREPIIIPHFGCHVFLHTFCTRFCENGTNTVLIREIMGHA